MNPSFGAANSTRLPTTRLAPSPTGALHLGNLRSFLINAALAHTNNWRVLLRIEDIDSPRVKQGAIESTIELLSWLGFTWDSEVIIQSNDSYRHEQAMQSLARQGSVYPSEHTRSDIEAAGSAPNQGEHEIRFPDSLRTAEREHTFNTSGVAWRFRTHDQEVAFTDVFAGLRAYNPYKEVGDFVVWTKRDTAAYQLAVIIDDNAQGVTDVVRGDDLLASTARQILLAEAVGIEAPRWCHVPLVLGEDGRRLAKRHGDTRIQTYREADVTRERLIGLCGYWCGVSSVREPCTFEDFCERFRLDTLPADPVVFTQEDHSWLLNRSLP